MRDCRCRMHGGLSTGAPRGNRNAFKHGLYSAKAIARRREVAALLQAMRELVGAAGELEIGGVGTSKYWINGQRGAGSHPQLGQVDLPRS